MRGRGRRRREMPAAVRPRTGGNWQPGHRRARGGRAVTPAELLALLRTWDAVLTTRGGKLFVSAPKGVLTPGTPSALAAAQGGASEPRLLVAHVPHGGGRRTKRRGFNDPHKSSAIRTPTFPLLLRRAPWQARWPRLSHRPLRFQLRRLAPQSVPSLLERLTRRVRSCRNSAGIVDFHSKMSQPVPCDTRAERVPPWQSVPGNASHPAIPGASVTPEGKSPDHVVPPAYATQGPPTSSRTVVLLDFETRSLVDLSHVGGRAYAEHPSTEVLCLVARLPNGAWVHWVPGTPAPETLLDEVAKRTPIVAHNGLGFDRHIWGRLGWPPATWIGQPSSGPFSPVFQAVWMALAQRSSVSPGRRRPPTDPGAEPARPSDRPVLRDHRGPACPRSALLPFGRRVVGPTLGGDSRSTH